MINSKENIVLTSEIDHAENFFNRSNIWENFANSMPIKAIVNNAQNYTNGNVYKICQYSLNGKLLKEKHDVYSSHDILTSKEVR